MGRHGAGHAAQIAGPGLAHGPEPYRGKPKGKGQNAKGKSNDRPVLKVCGFSRRRRQRAADLKTRSALRLLAFVLELVDRFTNSALRSDPKGSAAIGHSCRSGYSDRREAES
jgi:hypothetical protein